MHDFNSKTLTLITTSEPDHQEKNWCQSCEIMPIKADILNLNYKLVKHYLLLPKWARTQNMYLFLQLQAVLGEEIHPSGSSQGEYIQNWSRNHTQCLCYLQQAKRNHIQPWYVRATVNDFSSSVMTAEYNIYDSHDCGQRYFTWIFKNWITVLLYFWTVSFPYRTKDIYIYSILKKNVFYWFGWSWSKLALKSINYAN